MFRSMAIAACMAAMWSSTCLAQVTTELPAPTSVRKSTVVQRSWLNALADQQRARISERIGDDGARAMAKANGYETVFDGFDRLLQQGPDQVYRAGDGRLIVYEAKGGSSPLGSAYGYRQGTPEWAIGSAKHVLKSSKAGPAEKAAAREILDAAVGGKLEVHVVRTRHALGDPKAAIVESVATTTDDAVRLATSALDDLARAASSIADDVGRGANAGLAVSAVLTSSTAIETTDELAQSVQPGKIGRTASKALVVVGVVVDAGYRVSDAAAVEREYAAGTITEEKREVAHAKNAAGMAGGWGGAFGGAKGGAAVGGMVGGPWGAAAGGVVGGIGGYFGGEAAAEAAAEWTMDRVHKTGTTIRATWNWIWGY